MMKKQTVISMRDMVKLMEQQKQRQEIMREKENEDNDDPWI